MTLIKNNDIVSAINSNSLVLILGNGIDLAIASNGISWRSLLESLSQNIFGEILDDVKTLIEQNRYLLAAELLQKKCPNSQRFVDQVEDRFSRVSLVSTPANLYLVKLVAEISPQYIITTNYTKTIEDAFGRLAIPCKSIFTDSDINHTDHRPDVIKVIHIHGSTKKPVLSFSDYFENRLKNPEMYALFEHILCNYTSLSIGISLDETEFDIYEHFYRSSVRKGYQNEQHFINQSRKSECAEIKAEALKHIFKIETIFNDKNSDEHYINYYLRVLSYYLGESNKKYTDIFRQDISVFAGLFTKNVVIYPPFSNDDKSSILSYIRNSTPASSDEILPNSTISIEKIIENPGGAALVAAIAYSVLDGNRDFNTVLFSKALSSRIDTQNLVCDLKIGLNGVSESDTDPISVIINRPNTKLGDERTIFDYRDGKDYGAYDAILENEEYERDLINRIVKNSGLFYLDKWGKRWLELLDEQNIPENIEVVFDTGLTGARNQNGKFDPLETVTKRLTHLIASFQAAKNYLSWILEIDDIDCSNQVELYKCIEFNSDRLKEGIERKLSCCLKSFIVTCGAQDTLVVIKEDTIWNICNIPSIQIESPLTPLNPLGCGDVWRGAFSYSITKQRLTAKEAACLATLVSFWHLVGGIDNYGSTMNKMGLPTSIPKIEYLKRLSDSKVNAIANWKDETIRKCGVNIEDVLGRID